MLKEEDAIGDYTTISPTLKGVTDQTRKEMVRLIEKLVHLKGHKTAVLYLAVSLADKYLMLLIIC